MPLVCHIQSPPLPPETISTFLFCPAADVLKPDAILALCQVYQQHMKKVAAEVTQDQKVLTTNIKQVESFCVKVSQTMATKHAQAQYYSEHLKAVPQMLQLLEKTNALASKAIKSIEFLNSMLPVEERLEPISVHIPYNGEYQASLPPTQDGKLPVQIILMTK